MTTLPALDALFSQRHSCRAFRPDPVPRAVIEDILRCAQKVPSWCNAQPWQVTLFSGAATDALRSALMEAVMKDPVAPDLPFPERYSDEYKTRRQACGWALYEAVGVERGDRAASHQQMMRNFTLFDAPHCAILTSPKELGPYGALDCGGFVTGFTLAATAAGVATIAQAAVATYAPMLHQFCDIPEDRNILCALSFGYGDPDHPANQFRTERAELGDFTSWRD
ncbi:nitroreductase [Phaeobacter inhibens]|uniref:nitroreductase n=1 Tax=Phaeobacter inhibens TaxID=221822 RepID=UPI000160D5D0|nr:nitroreductase [Phaeobacter inhibens]AFO88092.1 nitroreductase-like protein [Phaeobacter inhibens 2.10]AUQ63167.1 nitroreductase-like protein [Phaeobacter inhibens]AUQ83071.1 nitroreductase-like protein [Phaeobacter inhibens]AUQ90832.1 nitroreductase-like protein [Phaeobacter inhibens]AXT42858.1 nitroreductase [Phaeobacter inhibens]